MTSSRPSPGSLAPRDGGCFPSLLFAVFFISGLVVLWVFFFEPLKLIVQATGWEKVPCTIVVSRVDELGYAERPGVPDTRPPAQRADPNSLSWMADVRYRYAYRGRMYASGRIWFIKPGPSDYYDVREIVDRYPANSHLVCYVNPKEPTFSVLDRGLKPELLPAVFPALLAILGLAGLVGQLARMKRGPLPPIEGRRPTDAFRPRQSLAASFSAHARVGPLIHKGRSGIGPFLGFTLLTFLWNAAMWFLLREVILTWLAGVPGCHGWLLTAIALPLLLIGLGLIAGWTYYLLRLFNPRPVLLLSCSAVAPGGSIDVSWRFSRRRGRIQRLRILLQGFEEATYAQQNRLFTAREIFATHDLLDTTDPRQFGGGRQKLTLPADAVPTFQSEHNRIGWAVRICAHTRGWPSIDDECEITVLPPSTTASSVPPPHSQSEDAPERTAT